MLIPVKMTPIQKALDTDTLNPNKGRTIKLAVTLIKKPIKVFNMDSIKECFLVCPLFIIESGYYRTPQNDLFLCDNS